MKFIINVDLSLKQFFFIANFLESLTKAIILIQLLRQGFEKKRIVRIERKIYLVLLRRDNVMYFKVYVFSSFISFRICLRLLTDRLAVPHGKFLHLHYPEVLRSKFLYI